MDQSELNGVKIPAWFGITLICTILGATAVYFAAATGFFTKDEATAESAQHQQAMETALRAAKPGDLIVTKNGAICVLGAGRDQVVVWDEAYYACGIFWQGSNHRLVKLLQPQVLEIVSKDHPVAYASLASCFLKGRAVAVDGSDKFTCGAD